MHCKSLWIKASAKWINVNAMPHLHYKQHTAAWQHNSILFNGEPAISSDMSEKM